MDQLQNLLLSALAPFEYQTILEFLEEVEVPIRRPLVPDNERIAHVYFPETMILSIVSVLDDGSTVELGTVGNEGMVGLPVFLGDENPNVRPFVQVPGRALRMKVRAFNMFARAPGTFHRIMLGYTRAFLFQIAQSAACNARHLVKERCARWLLMTHDRVNGDDLPITTDFLAFMLGARQAGVNVAMRRLEAQGVVRQVKQSVTILDRKGLEQAACDCYHRVRTHSQLMLTGI